MNNENVIYFIKSKYVPLMGKINKKTENDCEKVVSETERNAAFFKMCFLFWDFFK